MSTDRRRVSFALRILTGLIVGLVLSVAIGLLNREWLWETSRFTRDVGWLIGFVAVGVAFGLFIVARWSSATVLIVAGLWLLAAVVAASFGLGYPTSPFLTISPTVLVLSPTLVAAGIVKAVKERSPRERTASESA
jgi:hypothetical protein